MKCMYSRNRQQEGESESESESESEIESERSSKRVHIPSSLSLGSSSKSAEELDIYLLLNMSGSRLSACLHLLRFRLARLLYCLIDISRQSNPKRTQDELFCNVEMERRKCARYTRQLGREPDGIDYDMTDLRRIRVIAGNGRMESDVCLIAGLKITFIELVAFECCYAVSLSRQQCRILRTRPKTRKT